MAQKGRGEGDVGIKPQSGFKQKSILKIRVHETSNDSQRELNQITIVIYEGRGNLL